jgi:hypothetical protein
MWAPNQRPRRSAYQPPASSTFLSQQTSHQQPASSTFLSERTSTSHQPTEQAANVPGSFSSGKPIALFFLSNIRCGLCSCTSRHQGESFSFFLQFRANLILFYPRVESLLVTLILSACWVTLPVTLICTSQKSQSIEVLSFVQSFELTTSSLVFLLKLKRSTKFWSIHM